VTAVAGNVVMAESSAIDTGRRATASGVALSVEVEALSESESAREWMEQFESVEVDVVGVVAGHCPHSLC
jgi:hypothetical protein